MPTIRDSGRVVVNYISLGTVMLSATANQHFVDRCTTTCIESVVRLSISKLCLDQIDYENGQDITRNQSRRFGVAR